MAEAMTAAGLFRGPEGPRFHRNCGGRRCRAYCARNKRPRFLISSGTREGDRQRSAREADGTGRAKYLRRAWRAMPLQETQDGADAATPIERFAIPVCRQIPRLLRRGGLGMPVDFPGSTHEVRHEGAERSLDSSAAADPYETSSRLFRRRWRSRTPDGNLRNIFSYQRAVRLSPGEPDEIFSSFTDWQIWGGAPTVPSVRIGAERTTCTFSILCDQRNAGTYSTKVRGTSCFRNWAATIKRIPPMSVATAAVDME